MLSIMGYGIANNQNLYASGMGLRGYQRNASQGVQNVPAQAGKAQMAAAPAAQPDVPVQPVSAVSTAAPAALDLDALLRQWENDPVAIVARSRIQYLNDPSNDPAAQAMQPAGGASALPGAPDVPKLPGLPGGDAQSEQGRIAGLAEETQGLEGAKSAQQVMEEGECQTCRERKYQDGSDDPGVSFKTPTHISPEMAASQVRGHEMEHVTREQAKAQRNDRQVVSQSVTYHTGICPECGRVYVSGGTTRTVTAANNDQQETSDNQESGGFNAFA